MTDYRLPNAFESPRFAQIATFMRLPQARPGDALDVALIGMPFDGASSYRPGSRFGPREIRTHSALVRPYNPALEIDPFTVLRVADAGDVDTNPLDVLDTFARVQRFLAPWLDAGTAPIGVGGDHSLSLPILREVARKHGPVGMVHVDAHQDMWDAYFGNRYFHGTPFRRAVEEGVLDPKRTVQIGIRGPVYADDDFEFGKAHGVTVFPMPRVDAAGLGPFFEAVRVLGDGPVHLSFDIDGVDPAFAPGTGTPEPGGLSSREAQAIIRGLAGVNLVSADLVEVSPQFDHAAVTSMLAANLLFEMVSVFGWNRKQRA